jgi:hypothetical protein
MTQQERGDFCFDFARDGERAVTFRCSDETDVYPWLNLHPAHNIAVQATNYFALTGVSLFLGQMDGEKWTALTDFRWRCYNTGEGAAHPVRGRSTHSGNSDDPGYACAFFDTRDKPVYDVSGVGVVFRSRDFEGWRAKAKAEIAALPEPQGFEFATSEEAGVASQGEAFVSPLKDDDGAPYADALITAATGFRPAHPYHGGSGDHVNSSQLCDAVQQAAHLLGRRDYPSAGAAKFTRYVELGRPFRVASAPAPPERLVFEISQGRYKCATISFDYGDD